MTEPWRRDVEINHLHPLCRERVQGVLDACAREGIPFRMFEGYRSPHRQQYLYEQGRTRPGAIVTYAGPWSSIHEYGLAADFVLYENGGWSWDTSGSKEDWWSRLHEIGREYGLEPLSWETSHLQMSRVSLSDLKAGQYPGGDDPILVSAAYNAGGVYKSSKNPWCLRAYGDHLDRAARWYGDACAVLKEKA
jgi:peptidoglycan L-alanyl-D-glutamate endopeptidase CwlK